jgi:hypothetical protein
MRRIRLTMAAVAALVVAMLMGSAVLAQEQTTDEHPLVGSWVTDAAPGDATDPDGLTVFLPGGVVIDLEQGAVGAGTWSSTGEYTADVTIRSPANDPEAGFMGFLTIRGSVEVSEDGQTFTGTYTLEFPAGLSEALGLEAGEVGPGDVTGQRVALEPMGAPVGPIPEVGAPSPAPGGSPAAPEASPMAPEASPAAG